MLLSVPDVGVLVQSALGGMNPETGGQGPEAASRPSSPSCPESKLGATVVAVRRILTQVAWLQRGLFLLGIGSPHRRHPAPSRAPRGADAGRASGSWCVALLLALVIPAGRLVALLVTSDPAARGALFGVWRAYFLPLLGFIYWFGGTGVILAAASNSLHERTDPFAGLRRLARLWRRAADANGARGCSGSWAWRSAGAVVLAWPSSVVTIVAVIGGLLLVFAALRELFRLLLENVPEHTGSPRATSGRRWPLRAAVAFVVPAALVALLFLWRRPMDAAR